MTAYLTIGLPGSGKSLVNSKLFRRLLRRNMGWYKRTKQIRYVYSNIKVSEKWEKNHPGAAQFVKYWDNPMDLIVLKDVDVIWDEIARHLDSRDWKDLNPKFKKWIQEHDKLGIEIYANSQSPMQVDVMFRRNCEQVYRVYKLFGSRRPSPTKLPVRFIWGLLLIRRLKRVSFGHEEDEEEYEPEFLSFPQFRWIDRRTCEFFDTRQQIDFKYPPFEHIQRFCELHSSGECKHMKVDHL